MTNFFPFPNILSGPIAPFGNPTPVPQVNQNQPESIDPNPPQPQTGVGIAAQTQLSNGFMPHNTQSGVNQDSLLARISRGEVTLNQSLYGQASVQPNGSGVARVTPAPAPITTGDASQIPVSNPATYQGG